MNDIEGFRGFALVSPFSSCVECGPSNSQSTSLFCAACSSKYTGTCPSPTGVVTTNLDVQAMSRLLAALFSPARSLVFWVDAHSGYLMGINDPTIPVLTRQSQTGLYQFITVAKCSSPLVAHVGNTLQRLGWPEGLQQIDHISGTFYVQTAPFESINSFQIPGLSIRVVVVVPAPGVDDSVYVGSPNAYAVLGLALSGSIICLVSLVGVVVLRDKQVIKAAGVPWLLMFLVGVLGMNVSSFILIGSNSISSCFTYPWLLDVSFVASMTAVMVKTWRLHRIFNMTFEPVTDSQLAAVVSAPLLCVVLLLAIASSGEGFHPYDDVRVGLDGASGVYQFCRKPSIMIAVRVLIALLHCVGCFLSFRTRLVDPAFGESKAVLFLIFTSTLCCGFNLTIPSLVPSYTDQILTSVLAVWIGSVTSVCALLVPRFYGLLEFGDAAASDIARGEIDVVRKFSRKSTFAGTQPLQRDASRVRSASHVGHLPPSVLTSVLSTTHVDYPDLAAPHMSESPALDPDSASAIGAVDYLNVMWPPPSDQLSGQAYSELQLQGSYQPPSLESLRMREYSWAT
jgi:hypothetical protein